MIDKLDVKEWMQFNAGLQKKKNKVRTALKEKGVLQNKGKNDFDHYRYFSEAQYKELFTELFSENGLEMKFSEVGYDTFEGTQKQSNGRLVKLEFRLTDIDTGFYEITLITGEAIDKGDKAGYKAYTGALKYFLADTFMVATGDEVETESPVQEMNKVSERKASEKQIAILKKVYTGDRLIKLLQINNLEKLEDISMKKASELIGKLKEKEEMQNGTGTDID